MKIAYTVIGPKEALLTRLRCKQWSCEACAEKNAKAWQYWLIKRLPEVSDNWWLVTLTASERTRTTLSSLENLRSNIDRLIKRIRRIWSKGFEYVRVYEKHPTSQAIHVHFIMAGLTAYVVRLEKRNKTVAFVGAESRQGKKGSWSIKTWFKKTTREMGMGYICDARPFVGEVSKASFYITKYLTKGQQAIDVPYLRHVQVSKGIGSPQFEKSYEWTPASYVTARTFSEPNTRITDIDTGRVIDNDYWEACGYYPAED